MSKETKMTAAWAARVYTLSRKSAAEVVRLAGKLGVTTAEGFLRLREPRRRCIVELARLRGGTHPLKELEIILTSGISVEKRGDDRCSDDIVDLFRDAAETFLPYFMAMDFDHSGRAPKWLQIAEDAVALGLRPTGPRRACKPGACACDMSYQDA